MMSVRIYVRMYVGCFAKKGGTGGEAAGSAQGAARSGGDYSPVRLRGLRRRSADARNSIAGVPSVPVSYGPVRATRTLSRAGIH